MTVPLRLPRPAAALLALAVLAAPLAATLAPAAAQERPGRTAPAAERPARVSAPAAPAGRAAPAADGFDGAPARFRDARFADEGPRHDPPRITLVEREGGRLVYEVRADWDGPLAEAVRRYGTSPHALALGAVRGWATTSERVPLGAFEAPAVEVLAAEYDEAPLPARGPIGREGAEAPFASLTGPAAEVVAVGEERRRPTGTLAVRLLQVDPERGVVRRYRRLLVAVRTSAPPEEGAFFRGGVSPHVAVERSALAEGTWFKIPITREGVYRIDRAYLQALGVSGGLDPARLQVYHNGGGMLPEVNSAPRPADLLENPAWITGGEDGSFDDGDALYFYAEGPNGWRWRNDTLIAANSRWEHAINYFSTTSYAFLRVDGAGGARIEGGAFPGWADAERQDRFDGRLFVEEDRVNLERDGGGSGLEWLGTELSVTNPSAVVLDTVPPGLAAGTVRYQARIATRARPAVTLCFHGGGASLACATPPGIIGGQVTPLGYPRELAFEQGVAAGAPLSLELRMENASGTPLGWLDWLEAVYPQALDAHQGLLRFHTPGGRAGRFEFALGGFAAEPQVWDVTDLGAVRRLGVRAEGGRWLVQVEAADPAEPRELVAFEPSSARVVAPAPGGAVPNQNLHAVAGYPDYVVVTHATFRESAERLAEHRRAHDGLATVVVDVEQLYNEFSGGKVDMRAVRDYMKFLYDRATTDDELPRYLLLFGDGHYDYRGITAGGDQNNFVPVFQTFASLDHMVSYTTDDYFAVLGDDEGAWAFPGHNRASEERMDLGVGRLTVRTAAEATAAVAKILHYEDPSTLGAWRTRYTFVADDHLPGGDSDLHIQNADVVAEIVRDRFEDVNVEKVYSAAYPDVVTAVGRRIPEATADILRLLEEGTLVWNYSGHGGPFALADERLFEADDIPTLDNFDRLSVFVTATCSFGHFDFVDRQSAAELLLSEPDGGAVALFTTVRIVFASTDTTEYNLGLNLRLTDELLRRDGEGRPRRLGDAFFLAKNSDVGAHGNNRKFSLLGDPAMRIGLPNRPVAITEVNGIPLEGGALAAGEDGLAADLGGGGPRAPARRAEAGGARRGEPELRANELTEIRGQVLGYDGQPDLAFDGEVELEVFDATREVELDPAIYGRYTDGDFTVRTDRIYRGRASVRGGAFTARFIVPRDVSYSGLPGRISAYVRSNGALDGVGSTEAVRISATAGPPLDDRTGPQIRLFLNDSTFVDGGLVDAEPTLVVRLFDEHGINTVGTGVGHELLVTFDDDPASAVEVGRFYEGDLDAYQSGTVRFQLPPQAPGAHVLRVTAWDVANNASSAELRYAVAGSAALALRNVYNYPNPTPGPTRFIFEHNQPPGTMARVQLRIYTLAGRPVRTLELEEPLAGNLVQIPFDGLDEDLDPLASGVYLYRLRVAVDLPDGTTEVTEHVERLAVIR
jgi:hypothetical protein